MSTDEENRRDSSEERPDLIEWQRGLARMKDELRRASTPLHETPDRRDRFCAAALQGLLANPKLANPDRVRHAVELTAQDPDRPTGADWMATLALSCAHALHRQIVKDLRHRYSVAVEEARKLEGNS